MPDEKPKGPPIRLSRRLRRLLVVLAGIVLGQAIVYGPSLLGRKILLPLDILALPHMYLPSSPATHRLLPHHQGLPRRIHVDEISRRFAVSEFHAGRLPLWAPYQYAGVPYSWPIYSPLALLNFCTASPVILAWSQLLAAVVAGLGAYCFCRRVLRVGPGPAAGAGRCYPPAR